MNNGSQNLRHDWLGKSLAGALLGLLWAFQLSALIGSITTGGLPGSAAKVQLLMWMVPPTWMIILSACFMFRSGLRAWLWLGGACAVTALLLKSSHWITG